MLCEYVAAHGGEVKQVVEKRDEYRRERRFYYKLILPVEAFLHGLFVELVLADDDDELPSVLIVNAHEQRK